MVRGRIKRSIPKIALIMLLNIGALIMPVQDKAAQTVQSNPTTSDEGVQALPPGGTQGMISGATENTCVLADTQYTLQVTAQPPCSGIVVEVALTGTPNTKLYVRFGQKVTMEGGSIVADYKTESQNEVKSIVITPPYPGGTYYVAVTNCGPDPASYYLGYAMAIVDYFGPVIRSVRVHGKKLIVSGCLFGDGSVILLNNEEQPAVYDGQGEMPTLMAKKAGKRIAPGETVTVQVRDAGGILSQPFTYTRPLE